MADRWIPDGTQPAKPLPLFPDPVAGLITGVEAGQDVTGDRYDLAIPLAKPVEVDREGVEAMLHAVMDDPEEPPSGPRVDLPPPRKAALPTGAAMPGMIAPAEKLPARQRVRNMATGNGRQSSSNLGGWIVALILLLVFGAIAVSVIASIVEAIGGAFD